MSISDDGVVTIFAKDQTAFERAKSMVEASVGKEVEVGGRYAARVTAVKDFGAFMEIDGGYQGLLHISEIGHERIERVADVLSIGQQFSVLCIGRDLRGNLKLSRKSTLPAPVAFAAENTETSDEQQPVADLRQEVRDS